MKMCCRYSCQIIGQDCVLSGNEEVYSILKTQTDVEYTQMHVP